MKNYWGYAIILSFLLHAAFLTGVPTKLKNIFPKKETVAKGELVKEIKIDPQQIKPAAHKPLVNPETTQPLPFIDNIMSKLIQPNNFTPLQKPQIFEKNIKEIIFTEVPKKLDRELKKNPAYMNYYRLIRERIRTNAYHNYNSNKKGEVLISFLVEKNGSLKDVDLDYRSVNNRILRNIALKSIWESAPFPEFPEELAKYSHLQFNISIYFKNN